MVDVLLLLSKILPWPHGAPRFAFKIQLLSSLDTQVHVFCHRFLMASSESFAGPIPLGASRWLGGKESACQCRRHGFDPWAGKILWRRAWQPTPVFLPEKSHGQRSLVGYRPWGHRVRHDRATKQQLGFPLHK